jgi:hypothetical protein
VWTGPSRNAAIHVHQQAMLPCVVSFFHNATYILLHCADCYVMCSWCAVLCNAVLFIYLSSQCILRHRTPTAIPTTFYAYCIFTSIFILQEITTIQNF